MTRVLLMPHMQNFTELKPQPQDTETNCCRLQMSRVQLGRFKKWPRPLCPPLP